jgi:uncharacterized iron-regulated protein
MTLQSIARLCAGCLLGLILFLAFSSRDRADLSGADAPDKSAASVVSPRSRQFLQPQSVLQKLAQANVVYLGETHDRAEDHQAQLEIIQELHRLNPQVVIAMEMFQRPYQPALDAYLAGTLTEAELIEQSQYEKRWGFPWEFYAPILRFARENQRPVIALNTPTEVTRKVARLGLESLTLSDRQFIPPISDIALEPEAYRQRLRAIYDAAHHGKTSSGSFERFFQAQVLWDETMAERIAQILQQQPQSLVVVLLGQGHVVYGDGVPNRVVRRQPKVNQVSLLLNPSTNLQKETEQKIADYFWYSR